MEPTAPHPSCLIYKQSPVHGIGVFATEYIRPNTCLSTFTGTIYKWKDFINIYGRDYRYCYRKMRTHTIICSKEERCLATWINQADKPENANVLLKAGKLFSSKSIEEGQELFLWYSDGKIKYTL